MKVKANRSFYGAEGNVRRHQVIDVSQKRAKELFAKGLVGQDFAPEENEGKTKGKADTKSDRK